MDQRRCVACQGPDAHPRPIPIAAGARLEGLDDYLPPLALCPACAEQQRRALGRHRRWLYVGTSSAFVVALLVISLAPLPWLVAPLIAYILAAAAALQLLRRSARRAGAEVPLLILGGQGQELYLRVRARAHQKVGNGPFRSSAQTAAEAGSSRRRALGGGGWFYAFTLVASGASMLYVFPQCYPLVVLDNWSRHPYRVTIDDQAPRLLERRTSATLRLRAGHHRVEVTRGPAGKPEGLELELPWGRNHVLSLPGDRCYSEVDSRVSRAHRWADFGIRIRSESIISGRWVPLQDPRRAPSLDCDELDRSPL